MEQSKTSAIKEYQLPLKGMFSAEYKDARGNAFRFEAMGDGRYRVHFAKRQPRKK